MNLKRLWSAFTFIYLCFSALFSEEPHKEMGLSPERAKEMCDKSTGYLVSSGIFVVFAGFICSVLKIPGIFIFLLVVGWILFVSAIYFFDGKIFSPSLKKEKVEE
ncbi:MAG: hypothetical protein PHR36_00055 [Patescibacteria group bacterium]|nr:hypothetical protein [Patescibacteria group bacterium]